MFLCRNWDWIGSRWAKLSRFHFFKNWLRIISNLSEIVLRCQHVDNLILGGGQLLVKLGSTLSVQKAPQNFTVSQGEKKQDRKNSEKLCCKTYFLHLAMKRQSPTGRNSCRWYWMSDGVVEGGDKWVRSSCNKCPIWHWSWSRADEVYQGMFTEAPTISAFPFFHSNCRPFRERYLKFSILAERTYFWFLGLRGLLEECLRFPSL